MEIKTNSVYEVSLKAPLRISLIDVGTPRPEIDEPIGIEMIGGSLENTFGADIKVSMYSLKLDRSNRVPDYLLEDTQVIGIGSKLNSYEKTTSIIEQILRKDKNILIIVGNIYSTFAFGPLLEAFPEIICIRGEGENAIIGLMGIIFERPHISFDDIKYEICKRDIPNLVFMYNGKMVNTSRKLVNLEKVAKPSRNLLPHVLKYNGVVLAEASRGCPWSRCKFCAISGKYGKGDWRGFPIQWIIDELHDLSKHGARSPYFTDEDFFGPDPFRAKLIGDEIIEAKAAGLIRADMNIYFNARVNTILGKGFGGTNISIPLLRRLKEAGTREIFLGIESGSIKQIKRFGKSAKADYNLEALKLLRDLGFQVDVGFIMFDPEMTLNDLDYNIEFLRKAGLANHDARMTKKLRVEPFTSFENEMISKGLVSSSLDIDDLTYPYSFQDERVNDVYHIYRTWEKEIEELVYILQAKCRGEIPTEEKRLSNKKLLGMVRNLDLDFLDECVKLAKKNPKALKRSFKMRIIFKDRRQKLIASIKNHINLKNSCIKSL